MAETDYSEKYKNLSDEDLLRVMSEGGLHADAENALRQEMASRGLQPESADGIWAAWATKKEKEEKRILARCGAIS